MTRVIVILTRYTDKNENVYEKYVAGGEVVLVGIGPLFCFRLFSWPLFRSLEALKSQ